MGKPLPRTREELLCSLHEAGLPEVTAVHLAAQARPALLLSTTPYAASEIRLGASRLGGAPDLTIEASWPQRPPYPDAAKRSAAHIRKAEEYLDISKKPKAWMTP